MFSAGDMLEVVHDLILRKDGLTLGPDDEPFDETELYMAESLPSGSTCMYIREGEEDPEYVLAVKDMVGKPMFIKKKYLKLLSAAEDYEGDD